MRRHEFYADADPPEMVMAERLQSIAIGLERIADALEDGDG